MQVNICCWGWRDAARYINWRTCYCLATIASSWEIILVCRIDGDSSSRMVWFLLPFFFFFSCEASGVKHRIFKYIWKMSQIHLKERVWTFIECFYEMIFQHLWMHLSRDSYRKLCLSMIHNFVSGSDLLLFITLLYVLCVLALLNNDIRFHCVGTCMVTLESSLELRSPFWMRMRGEC